MSITASGREVFTSWRRCADATMTRFSICMAVISTGWQVKRPWAYTQARPGSWMATSSVAGSSRKCWIGRSRKSSVVLMGELCPVVADDLEGFAHVHVADHVDPTRLALQLGQHVGNIQPLAQQFVG